MRLPAVNLKLTVDQVNLLVRQHRTSQPSDIEYRIALGADPRVRPDGAERGPAAAYKHWHGDATLARKPDESNGPNGVSKTIQIRELDESRSNLWPRRHEY